MTREEADAVIGHEIAHIANGDMVTLALIQAWSIPSSCSLRALLAHLVDKIIFRTEQGTGPPFHQHDYCGIGAGCTRLYYRYGSPANANFVRTKAVRALLAAPI